MVTDEQDIESTENSEGLFSSLFSGPFPNVPKAPGSYPLVGQLPNLTDKEGKGVQQLLEQLHLLLIDEKNKTGFAYYQVMGDYFLVTNESKFISEILKKPEIFTREIMQLMGDLLGNNIFLATGEDREKRHPIYVNHIRTQASQYLAKVRKIAEIQISKTIQKNEKGRNPENFCANYGLQVMLATILKVQEIVKDDKDNIEKLDKLTKELKPILNEIMLEVMSFANVAKWQIPKYARYVLYRNENNDISEFRNKIQAKIANVLKIHLENPEKDSFIYELKEKIKDKDGNVDIKKLAGEIAGLLFAGFDSTATTLHFVLRHLALNPKIQDQLIQEIVNNNFSPEFTIEEFEEKVKKMPVLNAVIKETLRLHPPFEFLSRRVKQDITLGSAKLKKNHNVVLHLGSMQRNPNIWGKDANEFKPERFNKLTAEQRSAYLPFGTGPQGCTAENFANLELKVMLIELFSNYRISLQYEKNTKPEDLFKTTFAKGTPKPVHPVRLNLEEHQMKPSLQKNQGTKKEDKEEKDKEQQVEQTTATI